MRFLLSSAVQPPLHILWKVTVSPSNKQKIILFANSFRSKDWKRSTTLNCETWTRIKSFFCKLHKTPWNNSEFPKMKIYHNLVIVWIWKVSFDHYKVLCCWRDILSSFFSWIFYWKAISFSWYLFHIFIILLNFFFGTVFPF